MPDLDLEAKKYDLEREKFEEEKKRSARSQQFEELKFAAEQRSSNWVKLSTQLSVAIPIVTLLIGAVVGRLSDNAKRDRDQQQQVEKAHRDFIHRQLSAFYYPIEVRLQQDDDTWHLAFPQDTDPDSLKKLSRQHSQFSLYIQHKMLIPNHEQVLKIIEAHGDLIENGFEDDVARQHVDQLLTAISQYREHVALYIALRDNGLPMTPAEVDAQDKQDKGKFRYPEEFEDAVKNRIKDLYRQLSQLGEAPPSEAWLRGSHS